MPLKTLGLLALLVVAVFAVAICFARFVDWRTGLAILGLTLLITAWLCFKPHLRRILTLAAVALFAAAPLAACGTLGGADSTGKQILTNLAGCDRHYQGAIGAGVSGSFQIDCKAVPPAAGAMPAAGAAAAPAVAVSGSAP